MFQFAMLMMLYTLKSFKETGFVFPFFIALLGPIRTFVLSKMFTTHELDLLDSHGDDEDQEPLSAKCPPVVDHMLQRTIASGVKDLVTEEALSPKAISDLVKKGISFNSDKQVLEQALEKIQAEQKDISLVI
jgi:hypothetical protein